MKHTSFRKKRRIKFPMPETPGEIIKKLEGKAKRLCDQICKYQRCPVCSEKHGLWNFCDTVTHHLLNKGMYNHLRFVMYNLVPLCVFHHGWAHDESQEFLFWLQDNLPRHYRFYLNEKDNKRPVKQDAADLQTIIDDLQYYADNPKAAEDLIYEKE